MKIVYLYLLKCNMWFFIEPNYCSWVLLQVEHVQQQMLSTKANSSNIAANKNIKETEGS